MLSLNGTSSTTNSYRRHTFHHVETIHHLLSEYFSIEEDGRGWCPCPELPRQLTQMPIPLPVHPAISKGQGKFLPSRHFRNGRSQHRTCRSGGDLSPLLLPFNVSIISYSQTHKFYPSGQSLNLDTYVHTCVGTAQIKNWNTSIIPETSTMPPPSNRYSRGNR